MGLKEPFTGPAAERGTQVHNRIETYIRGQRDTLPWDAERPEFKVPALGRNHPMQAVCDRFRNWPNGDRHVERKFGFDIDWTPFPHDRDDTAYVVVFDAAASYNGKVEIGEWKTGKPYPEHREQRLLYGLAGLRLWYPKEVVVTTYYVDITSEPQRTRIPAAAEQELRDMWSSRRETIANDRILAPRPNDKCRYCHYRKSNGGPCPMNF
jgi:CRISPR/Cas system-associated exonuclease Cas4 (RecB family)